MNLIRHSVMQFMRDARGASAIEYALIALLIGVALIGSMTLFGNQLADVFNQAGNAFKNS